jgi:hypothetical protein
MLAMQTRQGHIDVSMACLPEWTERKEGENGTSFFVLRKPVFFTTSLLDVPPADPDARAVGTEDAPEEGNDPNIFVETAAKTINDTDLTTDNLEFMEGSMTIQELVEAFREVVAKENQAQFDKIVEAALKLPEVQTALDTVNAEVEKAKTDLISATTKNAELEAQVTTLTASVNTVTLTLEETKVAKEAAEARVAELTTEVESLRQFKAGVEEKAKVEARTALKDTRLSQLSKAAKDALDGRDEAIKEKLISRWTDADQDEWDIILASMNAAEPKGKFESASENEGALTPGGSSEVVSVDKVDKYLKATR